MQTLDIIQAVAAIRRRDIPTRARLVNRVSSIVEELAIRLNHEEGGELVENLTKVYDWWLKELFEASQKNEPERLEAIERQIAEHFARLPTDVTLGRRRARAATNSLRPRSRRVWAPSLWKWHEARRLD